MDFLLCRPASSRESVIKSDFKTLIDAGRRLIAEGGLRNLSIRSVVAASGWTMGELSYRIGKKDELVATLVEAERETARRADRSWLERLAVSGPLDPATLAVIIGTYLDEGQFHRREAILFWEEILLEAGRDERLSGLVGPWIEERETFWLDLLTDRHPQPGPMARSICRYLADETLYTVILGRDPTYRLVRDLCIHRLCQGVLAPGQGSDAALFEKLLGHTAGRYRPDISGGRARNVARTTARLMVEQGAGSITHRAVASALGQSTSAVSHHFRTRMDLIRAGVEALYDGFYETIEPSPPTQPDGAGTLAPARPVEGHEMGTSLSRVSHMLGLMSARDAAFQPLAIKGRLSRGRSSMLWAGAYLTDAGHFDRCSAQVASLVLGGSAKLALARNPSGEDIRPRNALADLAALAD